MVNIEKIPKFSEIVNGDEIVLKRRKIQLNCLFVYLYICLFDNKPPCFHPGSGQVRFESGESTTYYTVSERKDYACIPLQNDRVSVGVKHTFGAKDCQSDEIYPKVSYWLKLTEWAVEF